MPREKEWFDDESFWETMFPYMFPERRFANTPAQVDGLLALTGFGGGDVLDLCCGPGRFSLELAKRGCRVTGVDLTPFLLDKARRAGEEAGLNVEWQRGDMRDFVRPDAFDLALSMFTSFGTSTTPGRTRSSCGTSTRACAREGPSCST